MNEQNEQVVPLDRLILNLLALAEAAPALPPEKLARLASLADAIQPTVESLTAVSLRIHMELKEQPAFAQAKRAWDRLLPPERMGLDLGILNQRLGNPDEMPATAAQPLADVSGRILRAPQEAARDPSLLQRLAASIGLFWPRQALLQGGQQP
jgi:hypothetical protein